MQQLDLSVIKKLIRIYNRKPNNTIVKMVFDEVSEEIICMRVNGSRTTMSPQLFICFYYKHTRFEEISLAEISDAEKLVSARNDASYIKAKYHLDIPSGTVTEQFNDKQTALPLTSFVRLFTT